MQEKKRTRVLTGRELILRIGIFLELTGGETAVSANRRLMF